MKNPSQIERKDSSAVSGLQRKAPTRRVKVRLSQEGKAVIDNAERKRGLTKSKLAERAIRRELSQPAGKGRGANRITTTLTAEVGVLGVIVRRTGEIRTGALVWPREQFDQAVRAGRFLRTEIPYKPDAKPKRYERFLRSLSAAQRNALRDSVPLYWIDDEPARGNGRSVLISYRGELPDSAAAMLADRISFLAPDIPQEWEEVASIDFTGYLDRDCAERIIYKTPEDRLKAATSFDEGGSVIEDVTRQQVARWILECVIPEEFEPDFRRALPNAAAKGGAN